MVRGKGTGSGITAEPGTVEFRKQAYEASTKKFLGESEIKELTEEKEHLQVSIDQASEAGPGSSRAGGVNIESNRARIRQINNALETRSPHEAKGRAKDSLIREENEIEDRLIIGMPTRYEMDHPARCPGAVRKHLAWLNRNNQLIERYVEIQRILRPEEPKSVEALRKDK